MFALPFHFTHLMQPLDVGCFQLYKYYHSKTIDETMQIGILKFGKLDFLASLITICAKPFKKFTIVSGFKKTSLIPYDPEIVLQKICFTNSQTFLSWPVTPLSPANLFSDICNKILRECEQIVGKAYILFNIIQQNKQLVYQKFWPYLKQFICSSLISAFTHYLFDQNLDPTYKETAAYAIQKKLTRQIA